jgi:hypothetical protein
VIATWLAAELGYAEVAQRDLARPMDGVANPCRQPPRSAL